MRISRDWIAKRGEWTRVRAEWMRIPRARHLLGRSGVSVATLACALLIGLVGAGPALAGPWWRLSSRAAPTYLRPGQTGLIDVAADDLGDAGVTGSTSEVRIKDVLPPGVAVTEAGAINPHRARAGNRGSAEERAHWGCSLIERREVSCSTSLAIPPYELLEVEIPVEVNEPVGTVTSLSNQLSIEGGESEAGGGMVKGTSLIRPLAISNAPVPFGVEEGGYSLVPENDDGSLDTHAGSHPFQLTSTVDLNQRLEGVQEPGQKPLIEPAAPALAKDLSFSLPPGLLGNVTASEQCSELAFSALKSEGNSCPADSAIGVATVTVLEPSRADYITKAVPLFNLEPARGEPARFGFEAVRVPVILDTSVRTGSDYGVTVSVSDATEAAQVLGAQVTFWGEPDNQSHDNSRGWACNRGGAEAYEGESCEPLKFRSNVPFLTLPTSCTGQLGTSMEGLSWTGDHLQGEYTFQNDLGGVLERLEGCEALPFAPSIAVEAQEANEPDETGKPADEIPTRTASTPTGLQLQVKLPQQTTLEAERLAEADLRSSTVTLPEGMLLNPSAANGLQACSEAQIGFEGLAGIDPLSPGAPQPLRFSEEEDHCPQAAKVGSVQITTPLLSEPLSGGVYLAEPAPNGEEAKNPFDSLIALYITAENSKLGLHVKLAGKGELNQATGQLTTSFTTTPQVPFSELKLKLFGGPRASLSTPAQCGSYQTEASFGAWSGASAQASSQPSELQITEGVAGSPCPPNPLAFSPSFAAGSENLQAGAFTPFAVQIQRPDGQQALTGISFRLPPGVAALIAKTTPCPEPPQGQEWACGPQSLIGYIKQSVGLGSEPVQVTGQVYLTSGYDGAPFGVLAQTPAKAGPFDLGIVNVRSKIQIDPNTAQVAIQTDPGPRDEAIPTILKGIPVQLKNLEVIINRPEFQFNPTNCNPMTTTGTLGGAQGASANVSAHFQVANCKSLSFKPKLTASTRGQASKAGGASLDVKVTAPGLGGANIAKVHLQLPKALPARLTTIQKACTEAVFNANPAACPEASVIANATIHTPVLRNPLSGPGFLVSHGGAAFPDVEFILQGEGITLILDGKTQIKRGITYSKFESTPDAPFTTFETALPTGPHSALTTDLPEKAKFNLCSSSLSIPTEIVAQNGAVIKQNTKIAKQGCHKVGSVKAGLSRAQLLKRALTACRKQHKRSNVKRGACEKQARGRYAAKKVTHKAK